MGRERILVLGAGNMGGALLGGWLEAGWPAEDFTVVDPKVGDALASLVTRHKLRHLPAVPEDEGFDAVLLAIKPQMMSDTLPPLKAALGPAAMAISIAAGTPIAAIEAALGERPVVRAMPNTPALVGRGITGAYANLRTDASGRALAGSLLSATGPVEWVGSEAEIDAVTSLSGSGPAYVFLMAECMAKAGEEAGLDGETAMRLAQHTIAGAAELMLRSNEDPATLRDRVTSPGGTTAAALGELMAAHGLEALMMRAVLAARDRARELSKG